MSTRKDGKMEGKEQKGDGVYWGWKQMSFRARGNVFYLGCAGAGLSSPFRQKPKKPIPVWGEDTILVFHLHPFTGCIWKTRDSPTG